MLNAAATRVILGIASLRISRRLPLNSRANTERPVMLAPGREKLATNPSATKSPPDASTIGIVDVAFFAASPPGVPEVTIMSTFSLTSSATSAGRRSAFPSAQRYSTTTLRPSE